MLRLQGALLTPAKCAQPAKLRGFLAHAKQHFHTCYSGFRKLLAQVRVI